MLSLFVAGLATVGMVLFTLARLNMRRWLGYANLVELLFTIIMVYMLHKTFSGIIAASFAGIVMSVTLQVLRKTMGVERIRIRRVRWYKGGIRFYWQYIPASELGWFTSKVVHA